METRTTQVKLNVLTASEGHYLYKKTNDLSSAYFTCKVYLGTGDTADNYDEITDADYEREMKRREEADRAANEANQVEDAEVEEVEQ